MKSNAIFVMDYSSLRASSNVFPQVSKSTLIAEIERLQQMEDGWYSADGEPGRAPTDDVLASIWRLAEFTEVLGLPYPHVFPTVEGGVSAEWTFGKIEATIEFNPLHEGAIVASLNRTTDEFVPDC
jgi:hypothetical protein